MEYNWQRRWIPVDIGDAGSAGSVSARERTFLAIWEMQGSVDGVYLAALRNVPCLVLLGEPGMGKSYALRREQKSAEAVIDSDSIISFSVDLAGCQDEYDLRTRLFDNNKYRDWKAGTRHLVMYIDSVDQALESAADVVTVVCNELADSDTSRLKLRLVCRDHDWSLSLADALRHRWRCVDGAPVRVLQLAPLGADDIRLAAVANRKDGNTFLRQLEGANALPLATVPITLEMLLKTDEVTDSRVDLYREAMKRLCAPVNDSSSITEKDRQERFEKAARVAAAMVLGNKHLVDMSGRAALSNAAIAVSDMLENPYSDDEEKLLRDTVNSGLFQGSETRVSAHQSFAEYLTACYLSSDMVSLKDILRITTAPDGKFAPQLHETLRWLMEMRQDFLKEVVKREPMLALMSDLSHLSDREYRNFVKTLLGLGDPYVYSRETWELRNYRASHPGARKELLPYLKDTELSVYLRRFVFWLLECHGFPDMEAELVDLALNEYDDPVLRHWAARGIRDVGGVEARLKLKPYAFGKEDDPDDEIKGYALRALWPSHLTAEEVFKGLTPPKKDNFWGSYRGFLIENSIVDALQPTDLPPALRWVSAQPSRHETPFAFKDLPDQIMRKAWENRHVHGVLEAFAKAAIRRVFVLYDGLFGRPPNVYPPEEEHDEFENAFVQETQYRRELVLMCLSYLTASDEMAWRIAYTWPPIVVAEDLDWLLGQLEFETDEARRGQLAELVARLTRADVEKVYYASERHPELRERTKQYFESRLDDPDVISTRAHYYNIKEFDEYKQRQLTGPRPIEVIETALNRLESGETWQWIKVIGGLLLHPKGNHVSWQLDPNLFHYPSWQDCDGGTRRRIVGAAKRYVEQPYDEQPDATNCGWISSGSILPVDLLAGYLALFLLAQADSDFVLSLSPNAWGHWAATIVWYPKDIMRLADDTSNPSDRDLQVQLLQLAHEAAPYVFCKAYLRLLMTQAAAGDVWHSTLETARLCWSPQLKQVLLEALASSSTTPESQGKILGILLEKQSASAENIACDLLSRFGRVGIEDERVVHIAASMLMYARQPQWEAIWSVFQGDAELGRRIVEMLAHDYDNRSKVAANLPETQLAELYIWLQEQYPTEEDPDLDVPHAVSVRESVGTWRNSLLNNLSSRNSMEASIALEGICNRFPELHHPNMLRVKLKEEMEGREWIPVDPGDVLALQQQQEGVWRSCVSSIKRFVVRNWKLPASIAMREWLPF